MSMLEKTSLKLDITENANYAPSTAKRTFEITKDDPDATAREAFFAIQANFTGTAAVKICVLSGLDSGRVNPVYASFTGQLIPVQGIGWVTSGEDAYGNSHTTDAAVQNILAFGGCKVGA